MAPLSALRSGQARMKHRGDWKMNISQAKSIPLSEQHLGVITIVTEKQED